MHFLMRPAINDHPLPWQQAQTRLTPKRVRQRWWTMFVQTGAPARRRASVEA